ncbi:MAG: hypothetical protein JWP05_662 [Microbacteriaceae bacterium]|nr:hypothetical protein [Microbacteriaceae bacterium]
MFFNQTPLSCGCGEQIDVWDLVRGCFVGVGAVFSLLAPVGGQNSISTLTLKRREIYTLDLKTLGIEPTDIVTMVNFTAVSESAPEGGIFSSMTPAMLFGNAMPTKTALQHEMLIYPVPVGPKPPAEGTFNLYVHFIEEQREIHRALLLDAIRAHGEGDYKRSILNAHTAADTALENALSRRLGAREASKLGGEVNMGFRGKVQSLALARSSAGLHELSPTFVQHLYDLNARRNKVAHPSKEQGLLDQDGMADLLTAAVFLVELSESDFGLAP